MWNLQFELPLNVVQIGKSLSYFKNQLHAFWEDCYFVVKFVYFVYDLKNAHYYAKKKPFNA